MFIISKNKQTRKKTRIQKKAKEAKEEKRTSPENRLKKLICEDGGFNGNLLTAKSLQLYCKKKSMVCEF